MSMAASGTLCSLVMEALNHRRLTHEADRQVSLFDGPQQLWQILQSRQDRLGRHHFVTNATLHRRRLPDFRLLGPIHLIHLPEMNVQTVTV
jgi:hypothetical protein